MFTYQQDRNIGKCTCTYNLLQCSVSDLAWEFTFVARNRTSVWRHTSHVQYRVAGVEPVVTINIRAACAVGITWAQMIALFQTYPSTSYCIRMLGYSHGPKPNWNTCRTTSTTSCHFVSQQIMNTYCEVIGLLSHPPTLVQWIMLMSFNINFSWITFV